VGDDETEFKVKSVQVKGGYVVHVGSLEGQLSVGDQVTLGIDQQRRRLIMANHTGTHVLNFALRQVLGTEADQRGSLVAPDRLRFDFTNKGAMTVEQVKKSEGISNEMIAKNEKVYAKDSSLAVAKTIQGLRAVFEETYPDPVRVVSIGIPVEQLEADPTNPAGTQTSIEFCGGTHLERSGHIGDFVIATEEAIAKGIRRIVALTGPEAVKALKKAELLQKEVDLVSAKVEALIKKTDTTLTVKSLVRLIVDLTEDVSHANVSHWKKDELRNTLKGLKKKVDDLERLAKAAVITEVAKATEKLVVELAKEPFIVHQFHAFSNTKALDGALKIVKTKLPEVAAIFFSVDDDANKVVLLAASPKNMIERGLKASEWINSVTNLLDGKGGGRAESAQAIGNNPANVAQAMAKATEYARDKLGLTADAPVDAPTPAPAAAVVDNGMPTLYCAASSTRGSIVQVAARYAGKSLNVQTNGPLPSALTLSKVPALLDGSVSLVGTSAIVSYVAPSTLRGSNALEEAQVLQYINLADQELVPVVLSLLDGAPSAKSGVARARQELQRYLQALNQVLLTRTYLVGETVTMADVSLVCVLLPAVKSILDSSTRSKSANVMRWFHTIVNQPHVKAIVGDLKL